MSSRTGFAGVVCVMALALAAGGVRVLAQEGAHGAQGAKGAAAGKMQEKIAERNQKLMAAMQTSKVTLGQAVTAAEELTKGKAFTAGMSVNGQDGKLRIAVRLFADSKMVTVNVDPETGKATLHQGEGAEGSGGGG